MTNRITIHPIKRHPFTGTDLDPARKGYQLRTIQRATDELWGGDTGVPQDVALRNRTIWDWYAQRGIPEPWPSTRHLRRVFNDPHYSGQQADMSAYSDTGARRTHA